MENTNQDQMSQMGQNLSQKSIFLGKKEREVLKYILVRNQVWIGDLLDNFVWANKYQATFYRRLHTLEQKGLIMVYMLRNQETKRSRKYVALTPLGINIAFKIWLAETKRQNKAIVKAVKRDLKYSVNTDLDIIEHHSRALGDIIYSALSLLEGVSDKELSNQGYRYVNKLMDLLGDLDKLREMKEKVDDDE